MSLACETCPVRDSAACAVLSDAERRALSAAGRTRILERGETLFAAGDTNAACATLISGALKISSTDIDGNERILALVHPSGFVGEMFSPFAHYDVIALTGSELCTFAKTDLANALEIYPALARALLRRSQEDLHASRELIEMSGKNSAKDTVGTFLLALASAASASPCHPADQFDIPLSRGDMANMLGLTIETVSRQITGFEKAGAIRRKGGRRIELLDPALLTRD
ncbi:Crp/Fnr family transcriptional regulator [Altererythrobacter aquiaggeris]|uniref:Crp/Fnr family transcriptional regulator n=1 Tax=Aestuarierythrobacter aquiaggeris TaxID=1898396 RepID=UPI00301A2074